MFGIVVATHGEFGQDMVATLQMILGSSEGIQAIALLPSESLEGFKSKMEETLKKVDSKNQGALVLVDMIGGTPFNVAMLTAQTRPLQVVTGVNLPMLIQVATNQDEPNLETLAVETQKVAREGIVTSVEILKNKKV
ncbi:MAG TPA: PTS sugar transporter subunit IIA [bacterium]|nr:PTS sugar transporter subunit IIA [bacterium]